MKRLLDLVIYIAVGIGFVAVAMGVFGYGEIIANLAKTRKRAETAKTTTLLYCSG